MLARNKRPLTFYTESKCAKIDSCRYPTQFIARLNITCTLELETQLNSAVNDNRTRNN